MIEQMAIAPRLGQRDLALGLSRRAAAPAAGHRTGPFSGSVSACACAASAGASSSPTTARPATVPARRPRFAAAAPAAATSPSSPTRRAPRPVIRVLQPIVPERQRAGDRRARGLPAYAADRREGASPSCAAPRCGWRRAGRAVPRARADLLVDAPAGCAAMRPDRGTGAARPADGVPNREGSAPSRTCRRGSERPPRRYRAGRPRPVQGDQRHARPSRRRRAAADVARRLRGALRTTTSSGGSAATSSRVLLPGVADAGQARELVGHVRDELSPRSSSTASRVGSRRASAWPCSPSTGLTSSSCCSVPTRRCTTASAGRPASSSTSRAAQRTPATALGHAGELRHALERDELCCTTSPRSTCRRADARRRGAGALAAPAARAASPGRVPARRRASGLIEPLTSLGHPARAAKTSGVEGRPGGLAGVGERVGAQPRVGGLRRARPALLAASGTRLRPTCASRSPRPRWPATPSARERLDAWRLRRRGLGRRLRHAASRRLLRLRTLRSPR